MTTALLEPTVRPAGNGSALRRSGLRLLFLVPFAPRLDAPHGGGRVIAQLITHLADRHRIALCCLRSTGEPPVNGALREQCELVEEVVLPELDGTRGEQWGRRLQVWAQLLAGKPLWAIGRHSGAYEGRVLRLAQAWQPDIVQVEYHIMGQYLSSLDQCRAPRILVQHEPGKEAARETWLSRQGNGRLMPYLDWLAWQRFEKAVLRQVQTVVVFTERDRRTLAQLGQATPLVRIPLGAELPQRPLNPLGRQPPNLLFVGNFLHLPNADAALRLANGIYPRVVEQYPEVTLHIVGGHPPAALRHRANAQVAVTGYVPDVMPYLDQASVVVVPLRLGGGMRVKVLEALAAGKAIVASPLAAEGLQVTSGEQLLLAESDEAFASAILHLLARPEQRAALAERAREWASANLRWEPVAGAYEALYDALR